MTPNDRYASLTAMACNAGAHAAARRHQVKLGTAVPSLSTDAEDEANARAASIVPMILSGPRSADGYAEVYDSPGAMPPPPPPANGHTYSPEERSLIFRTALSRMGHVMRDRVDRENLAAGGHLRVASAPWTSPTLAQPSSGDARGAPNSATDLEYRGSVDAFDLVDRGAGLGSRGALKGRLPKITSPIESLTADMFAQLAQRDAASMEEAARTADPLSDTRERQRERGHSAGTEAVTWGPAFGTTGGAASSGPLTTTGLSR